jgi:hypothetical protein
MNDAMERLWKEVVVAYLRYYFGIHLERPRNTVKVLVKIVGLFVEV